MTKWHPRALGAFWEILGRPLIEPWWGQYIWTHIVQRWKNIQACEQCLCKFFSSSGKICAKLYGILLEKWGMSQLRVFIVIFWQICDYLWRFMVLFGTFMALYALFGTFGLLHCFVENSLLSQFTHFFLGQIVLSQTFLVYILCIFPCLCTCMHFYSVLSSAVQCFNALLWRRATE